MEECCAFLRGVNIGSKTMKMAEVCEVLKSAGLQGVQSFQATGNIIFTSDLKKDDARTFIERVLSDHYKENVYVFIKGKEDIEGAIKDIPFEKDDEHHIYVFISEEGFQKILMEEFNKIEPSEGEEADIKNDIFYWKCRKGSTLDSGFSKILGRKNMRDKFTSRNITTLEKIVRKMQ